MHIVPLAFYVTVATAFTFSVLSMIRVVLLSRARAIMVFVCGLASVSLAWNRTLVALAFTTLLACSYVALGAWRHRRRAYPRYRG